MPRFTEAPALLGFSHRGFCYGPVSCTAGRGPQASGAERAPLGSPARPAPLGARSLLTVTPSSGPPEPLALHSSLQMVMALWGPIVSGSGSGGGRTAGELPEPDSSAGKGIFSYVSPEGLALRSPGWSIRHSRIWTEPSLLGRPALAPSISLENLLSLRPPLWLPSQ